MPGQLQLSRDGRKLGQLVPARVDVRFEARKRELLGQHHSADGLVALEDEHLEPRLRQVAGTRQPVLSSSHHQGVTLFCHRFTSTPLHLMLSRRSPSSPPHNVSLRVVYALSPIS